MVGTDGAVQWLGSPATSLLHLALVSPLVHSMEMLLSHCATMAECVGVTVFVFAGRVLCAHSCSGHIRFSFAHSLFSLGVDARSIVSLFPLFLSSVALPINQTYRHLIATLFLFAFVVSSIPWLALFSRAIRSFTIYSRRNISIYTHRLVAFWLIFSPITVLFLVVCAAFLFA